MTLARRLTGLEREGAAPPTPPGSITADLVAWWDASTLGLADNASVSSWADSSGNGKTLTEGTNPPTYKTAIQNSLGVVRFDGSNDILRNTSFPDFSDAYTCYIVGCFANTANSDRAFFDVTPSTSTNTGFAMFFSGGGLIFRGVDASTTVNASDDIGSGDVTDGVFRVWVGKCNGTGIYGWRDGNAFTNGQGSSYTAPNPNTLARITVGALANPIFFHEGDIGELLIYSASHSDGDRDTIEAALGTKWGITVA